MATNSHKRDAALLVRMARHRKVYQVQSRSCFNDITCECMGYHFSIRGNGICRNNVPMQEAWFIVTGKEYHSDRKAKANGRQLAK